MKRFFLFLVAFLSFIAPNLAQDFQGKAIYQSKTSMGDFNFGGRDMPEEQKKRIMERMKQMFEKTYVLNFDKSAAIYTEEEKLEAPSAGGGGTRFGSFGGSGKLYKNVQNQSYTKETEMFGKIFLIKDSLQRLEWKMGTESKKIGNYTAYKATAIKSVDSTSFEAMRTRRQKQREKEEEEKGVKKDSTKNRSMFTVNSSEAKEIEITAWFTPEIPISQGPDDYWGLPGLILEVNAGNTIILCTKIVMNAEEKETIEAPKKGKEVSQLEYNKIMLDKMEEMAEQFRGRGGNGGGIRFGN